MSVEPVKIGLLGLGTVGGGVYDLLARNGDVLCDKTGLDIRLERILVRDLTRSRAVEPPRELFTTDAEELLGDPSISLVIELMGGIEPARTYIAAALQRGKHVITANKDLMALHGTELVSLARSCRRNIYFEASVGGGIPLVRVLQQSLVANQIGRLIAIINGTTNYILTRMEQECMLLDEALAKARALGFAEADPSNDLEGKDAAYKLAILAGLAFGSRIALPEIHVEGICAVTPQDICYARELGYVLRLLAVGERLENTLGLRVHPALVPREHPLASVRDEFNAVFIQGDAVGEIMLYGRGAGAAPTASSVMADVVEAARRLRGQVNNEEPEPFFRDMPVCSVYSLESSFYLRLLVEDRPGVFAALATAFGEEQVSLDLIIQKRSENGIAEVVLVTHNVLEERFWRALQSILRLPVVKPKHSVFRVLV